MDHIHGRAAGARGARARPIGRILAQYSPVFDVKPLPQRPSPNESATATRLWPRGPLGTPIGPDPEPRSPFRQPSRDSTVGAVRTVHPNHRRPHLSRKVQSGLVRSRFTQYGPPGGHRGSRHGEAWVDSPAPDRDSNARVASRFDHLNPTRTRVVARQAQSRQSTI